MSHINRLRHILEFQLGIAFDERHLLSLVVEDGL